MDDMNYALGLAGGANPLAVATRVASKSGFWSDPNSWGGSDPKSFGPTDFLYNPTGIALQFDALMTAPVKTFRNDGSFKVVEVATSRLWAELVLTAMGSQTIIGTDAAPVTGQFQHLIADTGPMDVAADPKLMGRGFLNLGQVSWCGATITPRLFSTGTPANVATVRLLTPANDWKVGDRIVLPGIANNWWDQFGLNPATAQDDDERTITQISPDGLMLTLDSPTTYSHVVYDDPIYGHRPSPVLNITPRRTVQWTSENTDIKRRGHCMSMTNMVTGCHGQFIDLGRTDKSQPITDPDGIGGGTENVRGRYDGPPHFHLAGAGTINSVKARIEANLTIGGKSWHYVNHGSNVHFKGNLSYKYYAAAFMCEIGSETTIFEDNSAIRSTQGWNAADVSQKGNNDWAKFGHGFWTHGGQTEWRGLNISTGHGNSALVIMGLAFDQFGPVSFASANLPDPSVTPLPQITPSSVPQTIPDGTIAAWGGPSGFIPWALNGNPAHAPDIAASFMGENYFEATGTGCALGYLSWVKLSKTHFRSALDSRVKNIGVSHSGVNGNCPMDGITCDGFAVSVQAATDEVFNQISNARFRCPTGIYQSNPRHRPYALAISNIVMDGGGVRLKLRWDGLNSSLYDLFNGFIWVAQNMYVAHLQHRPDPGGIPGDQPFAQCTITLDGQRVYFPEQDPAFDLHNLCMHALGNPNELPQQYIDLGTTGEVWKQFQQAIYGELLPAGLTKLPDVIGSLGSGDTTNTMGGPVPPDPIPPTPAVAMMTETPYAQTTVNGKTIFHA